MAECIVSQIHSLKFQFKMSAGLTPSGGLEGSIGFMPLSLRMVVTGVLGIPWLIEASLLSLPLVSCSIVPELCVSSLLMRTPAVLD